MNSVIIFDISNNGTSIIRERMRALGYLTTWTFEGPNNTRPIINLPHNVVWRINTENLQAVTDLRSAITQTNLNRVGQPQFILQRCVVLNSTPWHAIYGEPL